MAADPTAVVIIVDGKTSTPFARYGRLRIDDLLNDAPNTAALTVVAEPRSASAAAFAPHAFDNAAFATDPGFVSITPPPILPGASIAIYLGAIDPATQIFGGQITVREQYAELDVPAHVRYDLSCIDYSKRLNHRKVTTEYLTASVTTIVLDVIARFAPVITTAHVQAGLPSIPGMTFTFEDVSGALSRLAAMIGAYWYVDYVGDLHFFIGTEPGPAPAPLTPGGRYSGLKISADLTQVRTRLIVEGDGATAAATLATPDTLIPLSTAQPFNAAGGRAKIGTALVTYTATNPGGVKANTTAPLPPGTAPVDPIPPPTAPAAPGVALAPTTTPGNVSGGPYQYAVTLELADGRRSDVGAASAPITITPAAAPPPTTAAFLAPSARGPIAVGVASSYATAFVDAAGHLTPATTGGTVLTGRAVATPTGGIPFQVLAAGNGRMKIGSYHYAISFLTPHGETLPIQSTPSTRIPITEDNSAVILNSIPVAFGDARVTGRRVYRSSANPDQSQQAVAVFPWHHVIDIPDNTSSQYTDRAADSELATATLPAFSTANDVGEAATATVPTSSDPRVVGRRLYRQDGAGGFRLVADLKDNATTTYNDVVVGGGGELAPTVNAITTGAILVSAIATGPAGTTRRRLFRTVAGGSQWRELLTLNDNTTTTYTDKDPDSALGGAPLPAQGLPGSPGGAGGVAPPTAAGATTIELDSLAGIPAAGWILVETQVIRYTGTSTAAGRFFLTGIPAAGPGAITADLLAGTVVSTAPALVGVAPAQRVTIGDDVNLIVYVDDLAAQAALAAVEGGDGIIEHYIQDRRLSEDGARARGLAELALFKTIETRLTYTTHDPEARSGRTVHVALPAPTNLTGDFLIQRVTIDDVAYAAGTYPRRVVDASTTRFSFDDVLNRVLLGQV
jgi:hypothetical protein